MMPIRSVIVSVATAAALMVLASAANANVTVRETTTYYSIKGGTGLDLGRAMLSGGSKAIRMRHAIAATATRFEFPELDLEVKNGRCVVKKVSITLSINYRFPKWNDRGRAGGQLRRAWDSFYSELVRHEYTHGAIAKKFSREIERELKALSGTVAFGCRDIVRMAEIRFDALARQLKVKQLAFDRREGRASSKISRLQVALLKTR